MAAVITVGLAHAANTSRGGENDGAQELAALVNAKTTLAEAIDQERRDGLCNRGPEGQYRPKGARHPAELQLLKVAAVASEQGENGEHDND
jgi:hypothetical protein